MGGPSCGAMAMNVHGVCGSEHVYIATKAFCNEPSNEVRRKCLTMVGEAMIKLM